MAEVGTATTEPWPALVQAVIDAGLALSEHTGTQRLVGEIGEACYGGRMSRALKARRAFDGQRLREHKERKCRDGHGEGPARPSVSGSPGAGDQGILMAQEAEKEGEARSWQVLESGRRSLEWGPVGSGDPREGLRQERARNPAIF